MYFEEGIFGRTDPAFVTPAKQRRLTGDQMIWCYSWLCFWITYSFKQYWEPVEEAFAEEGKLLAESCWGLLEWRQPELSDIRPNTTWLEVLIKCNKHE